MTSSPGAEAAVMASTDLLHWHWCICPDTYIADWPIFNQLLVIGHSEPLCNPPCSPPVLRRR